MPRGPTTSPQALSRGNAAFSTNATSRPAPGQHVGGDGAGGTATHDDDVKARCHHTDPLWLQGSTVRSSHPRRCDAPVRRRRSKPVRAGIVHASPEALRPLGRGPLHGPERPMAAGHDRSDRGRIGADRTRRCLRDRRRRPTAGRADLRRRGRRGPHHGDAGAGTPEHRRGGTERPRQSRGGPG